MAIRTKIDEVDEVYVNVNDFMLFLMRKALNKDLTDAQREAQKLAISYLEEIKKRK